MAKLSFLLPVVLLGCAVECVGQASPGAQDLTFQVSSARAWTDTSLDLQSGDVVEISAVPMAPSGSGGTACDPNGLSSNASPSNLPLAAAPPGALIVRLHPQGAAPLLVGGSKKF